MPRMRAGIALRGSGKWCRGTPIAGMSKHAPNAACERACDNNPDCRYYGIRHADHWCDFWVAAACEGYGTSMNDFRKEMYYDSPGHSVYYKGVFFC